MSMGSAAVFPACGTGAKAAREQKPGKEGLAV